MVITSERKDYYAVALGVLGAITTLLGIFQSHSNVFYVVGSVFLLFTAAYYKLVFFIALEMILIAGHGTVLLEIGPTLQVVLPLLLSLQLLFFYFSSNQIKDPLVLIGVLGIGTLSVGFAYQNQWVFFIGSSAIAAYAFYLAKNTTKVAYVWAVLNVVFACIAVAKLILGN